MEQAPKKGIGRIDGFIFHDTSDRPPVRKAKGPTPNRYKPHQGKREMERRARKMKGQQA